MGCRGRRRDCRHRFANDRARGFVYSQHGRSADAQGQGVGHKLLEAVNEYADESEHDTNIFIHDVFCPSAKEMYEKHGLSMGPRHDRRRVVRCART